MDILIWEARTFKNMTLEELSRETGISKSALSNYENGLRYPDMKQMETLAQVLDTKIEKLYKSKYK